LRAKWDDGAHAPLWEGPHPGGVDHRHHDRFRAWGTLALYRFELAPQEGEHIGVVEDASPGGLYIAIQQPPPVGTLLRLQIYSHAGPRGSSVVRARAKVRWCRLLHEPRGAGVQLLDFAEGDRGQAIWLAMLRRQCPDAGPAPSPRPEAGHQARSR
jgi:hypothetical protein